MKINILLVDDDTDTYELVRNALDPMWSVHWVKTLDEARDSTQDQFFDLVLLDVDLPDGSGFQFCMELLLKTENTNPLVFFLSARKSESDVVTGFWQGADDYIKKPFQPMELKARIQSRLRKKKNQKVDSSEIQRGDLLLEINTQSVFLKKDQKKSRIHLTRSEFKILHSLMKTEDVLVSREALIEQIYDSQEVTDRAIDQHMSRLRKKIQLSMMEIEPAYGEGYRLIPKR